MYWYMIRTLSLTPRECMHLKRIHEDPSCINSAP
jgi:hypothetical protein